MKNFFWILTHYLKRNFLDIPNYLLIGLPLVFIFAFQLITDFLTANDIDGSGLSGLTIVIVLAFQFFGADLVSDWLHQDLKGSTRLRLYVSGNDQRVFYFAVVIAGWLFNILMGTILIAITSLVPFINANWGNYVLAFIVIIFLSFLTKLIGVLIFYFTKDNKSGARFSYLFGEAMIGIALFPAIFNLPDIVRTVTDFLPIGLGLRITETSTFGSTLPYFGILLAMNIVLAMTVLLIGRRKNNDSI